ncbi:MAG: hypothetical protein AAF664_13080 [Planctomycetota bacterium]
MSKGTTNTDERLVEGDVDSRTLKQSQESESGAIRSQVDDERNPYRAPSVPNAELLSRSSFLIDVAFVIVLVLSALLGLSAVHGLQNYFKLTAGLFPIRPMPAYALAIPAVTGFSALAMFYSAIKLKQRKKRTAMFAFALAFILGTVVNQVLAYLLTSD